MVNKIMLIPIFTIFTIGILGTSIFAADSTLDEYLTYRSTNLGFSIQYPSNWEVKELDLSPTSTVAFVPLYEETSDMREGGIMVSIREIGVWDDLNKFNDVQMEILSKNREDLKWLERGSTTLAGNPGYRVLFSSQVMGFDGEDKNAIIWTIKDDKLYDLSLTTTTDNFSNYLPVFEHMIDSFEIITLESDSQVGGGCLIATATYGSELAPQVQQLRELRDNKLLKTEAGLSFINTFNDFYYSFSPYIADYERENPVFKGMVKIAITPMISSLSILNYVDMDSETDILGYGISLILLNLGMYFVAPVIVIMGIRKMF